MKILDRVKTVYKPEAIQVLSSNSYYYNYDILPCKITVCKEDNIEEEKDGWSYIVVYIKGVPSYNDCVKSVIRKYISSDEEFDLINSYNKSIIEGKSSKVAEEYFLYLALLDTIKSNTKKLFK